MKRVCIERNCMALIEMNAGPRCLPHKGAYQRRRGSAAARGYNYTYLKLRRQILSVRPSEPPKTCVYCGAFADTVDHVIPLADGGTNTLHNLVPCCRTCNFSHGGRRRRRGGGR